MANLPIKTFWWNRGRSSALKPFPWVNMFGCQHFREASRTLELHRNTGIEIHFVHRGIYRWEVEGRLHEVRPGDAFITRPWETHGGEEGIKHKGILSWIIVDPVRFTASGSLRLGSWSGLSRGEESELGRLLASPTHHLPAFNLRPAFEAIHREMSERKPAFRNRVHGLIAGLLIEAGRRIGSNEVDRTPKDFLAGLNRLLHRDLAATPPVRVLASHFGLGVPAFTRAVHRASGLSPHAYLNRLRIEEAIRRIRAKVSLAEVALACGFSSQQHFGNVFKVITGFTPGEYGARSERRDGDAKHPFPVHGVPGTRRPRLR